MCACYSILSACIGPSFHWDRLQHRNDLIWNEWRLTDGWMDGLITINPIH